MKKIKVERTVYDIRYEAYDGKIFTSQEECEKYDNTAKATIWQQFKHLIVSEYTEYDLLDAGSDETKVYAIQMSEPKDMQIVMQFYLLNNLWLEQSKEDERFKERAFALINQAFTEQDILFVGVNYDDNAYILNTRNNIINRLQALNTTIK